MNEDWPGMMMMGKIQQQLKFDWGFQVFVVLQRI